VKSKVKTVAKKPVKKAALKVAARKPAAKAKAKAKSAPKKPVRKLITSGSTWEPIIGYSRAVRVGNAVYVSGTTAPAPEGMPSNSMYGQTQQALKKILDAVAVEGVKAEHAVRTRIFMTDISQWQEAAKAHGEIFGTIRPACTMVEVSKLIDAHLVVEIEADFVIA
jgi:enamine deaminase RidA (YjgF/YER057c/UK114 family)